MPKQRKSDLLKQDVEAWNQLRRREKNVKLSLKGEDLSQSDLAEANLSGIDLRGAAGPAQRIRQLDRGTACSLVYTLLKGSLVIEKPGLFPAQHPEQASLVKRMA